MNLKSNNYNILKQLMSNSRRFKLPPQIDYIVLYTFLYKYCSDIVKDYLLMELKNAEVTLDEAYGNKVFQSQLRLDSLKLNGFFIKRPEAFIEEVVNDNYLKPDFLQYFLNAFPKYAVFSSEYHNMEYFNHLFKTIDEIDIYEFSNEGSENICEVIYLISKLNVFEQDFEFKEVFNVISSSRLIHVESNPDYITQVLSELVLSDKKRMGSVYDPFIKNGDSIMSLNESNIQYCYGKDENKSNFLYVFAKFFINNFPSNNVFLKHENAINSIDINGASFDVILSRIPIAIKNYHSSNFQQNMEIVKRSKRCEIETLLVDKLNIDENSFKQDYELNKALENLVDKIDLNDLNVDFSGEYKSLADSEFLFLINLADSLKDDGIMVISISENFLFKDSLEILRKYLTLEKNYIDTIIRIPSEIDKSGPEVVIVFRKDKVYRNILFIDMSSDYETQRAKRVFPGLFRKNLILDNKTIDKMKKVFSDKLTVSKFSNFISINEIKKNKFNLSVSRYVDTFEGEFISLDELISQKEDIDSNINRLNLKIEKMMDELNIRF